MNEGQSPASGQQPQRPNPPQRPPPQAQPSGAGGPNQSRRSAFMPSPEELALVGTEVRANKVATREIMESLFADIKAAHSNATAADLFSLAWACYHNGSSRLTTLEGNSTHQIALATLKDIVERHCTLRQFCMYYAKVCYNKGKSEKQPPANWQAKGFKEESKYAAFDFFSGVSNDASETPEGGMKYNPTPEEVKAAAINSKFAIIESREQENQFSTRGNMLAMQQVRAPPAAPLITFD